MKTLPSFTHPSLFPKLFEFLSLLEEHKQRYFEEYWKLTRRKKDILFVCGTLVLLDEIALLNQASNDWLGKKIWSWIFLDCKNLEIAHGQRFTHTLIIITETNIV